MADSKISALTAVATPAGTDEFPVNQGGTSKKETLTQIKSFVETGLLAPGQNGGGQAAVQVQIGSGASADGNNATYGSVAVGHSATAGGASNVGSVAVGSVSASTGALSLAVGTNSTASGSNSTAIGTSTSATAAVAIAVGANSQATANNAVAIGSVASANLAIAIGGNGSVSCAHADSICIGLESSTATRQLTIGGDPYNDSHSLLTGYFGGIVHAAPPGFTATTAGGSGTNVTGGSFTVAGGKGTGNAAGGAVIFSTSDPGGSGSTLQSLTEKCRVPAGGGFQLTGNGSKPTAGSAYRGTFWYTPGGAGVADTIEICAKSAADTYSWVKLSTLIV